MSLFLQTFRCSISVTLVSFPAGNCFYLSKRTVLIDMRFFTAPLCHLYCWSVIWCGSLLQSDQTEPFQRRLFLSPDHLLPSTGNLHLPLCTHLPSNRNKWNEFSPVWKFFKAKLSISFLLLTQRNFFSILFLFSDQTIYMRTQLRTQFGCLKKLKIWKMICIRIRSAQLE